MSNKTIVFQNYFWKKLFILKNSRMLISNMAVVLEIIAKKHPNKGLFDANFETFVLHETLHFDKFHDVDFKSYDSFCKISV